MKHALLAGSLALLIPSQALSLDPDALWRAWPAERFVATPAPCLRPAALADALRALADRHPEIALAEVGRSVEGRPIHLATLGTGARRVLLWSQMHGDEPSATPALLDLAHWLLTHRDDPDAAAVLDRLTLLMVPMLNPDGAEAYTRRNAQGIDVNRDALNLTTPEGRLLKALRDEHGPVLGFNLHDQDRRRSVGDTGVLATVGLLAVTGDAAQSVTPGRALAMRACVAIAAAVAPYAPGGVARYDATWSPRAFGDNVTAWGTPVVLIESGGVPPGASLAELTRLNVVALATALAGLARDDLAAWDAAAYEAIGENNIDVWSDVAVRGGAILQPGTPAPYRADLAFDLRRGDREVTACVPPPAATPRSQIAELGDARVFGAGREVDARGKVLLAPFTVGASGWKARRRLDAGALERLGRLGVARVVWVVATRHVGPALRHARALAGAGRPRVEVTDEAGALPLRVLARAPAAPAAATLAGRIAALDAACGRRDGGALPESLAALWASRNPLLRYQGPASFTLLAPAAGAADLGAAAPGAAGAGMSDLGAAAPGAAGAGMSDLGAAAVEMTFLDGVDLAGGGR